MLHSCDAGEYSVITGYAPGYELKNPTDGYSEMIFKTLKTTVIFVQDILKSKFLQSQVDYVQKNRDKLTRPFKTHAYSGHFNFSHGHFLLNAGYDDKYNNVF